MKKLTSSIAACALSAVTMCSCGAGQDPIDPPSSTPTIALLNKFENELNTQEKANVFSVAVYQDGDLQTRSFGKSNPCQNAYSVAKTFIVTAIGLLVDQGLLTIDETVVDILADELPETYNEVWSQTTVEMLMLHNVGLSAGFLDIDVLDATTFGEDYLSYVLNAPIREDYNPLGNSYTYTDAAYYLLSRIVEKKSGMGTDDFLWKYLFYPIGCRETAWSHCPKGHVIGATGLYIRAEDLVKHGVIYLNGGMYGDKRILSQGWVQTVLDRGYEFRSYDKGVSFRKGGMRGQMLIIVPRMKRVMAWLGCGENDFTSVATSVIE